jgi:hypothetical protein
MKWKTLFRELEFINDLIDQEYKGDYTGYIFDEYWGFDVLVYIEEKEVNSDSIFIETWSCREVKNIGWIYKQLDTEYLVYITNEYEYLIDYEKLRKIWFRIYPNPLKVNDYNIRNSISYKYEDWYWNKVQGTKNNSEGYYIPIQFFYKNNLILKEFKK